METDGPPQISQVLVAMLDQNLSLGFWTTDTDLRFTSSGGRITGDEDSLVGTTLFDFFSPSDPDLSPIAAHRRALAGEAAFYDVEWEGRHLRCFVGPLRDEQGAIGGVVGVGVDVNVLAEVARVSRDVVARAHHRRVRPGPAPNITRLLSVGGLEIDPQRFEVRKNGATISLSLTEFNLLKELALDPGAVLSRRVLAERVWGHGSYADSPAVTMAISRLRDKIEDDPANPSIIQTVRGVGYRLADGQGPGPGA